MGSYLPENTYVVCLNQLGKEYKQLKVSDLRENKTVMLGSQKRPFLVVLDKKLSDNFTCKSGWSSGAGTAAIGAGVALGLAASVGYGVVVSGLSVALAVSTVPVAGWIVGGLIAIGCIGYGIWLMLQSPTCNDMIGYEESYWRSHHQTVRFDSKNVQLKNKHLALVKNSKLVCKEPGGVLLPFISETLAKQAAEAIGSNNQTEMSINIGAGLFGGFLIGLGLGPGAAVLSGAGATNATAWISGGQFLASIPLGHYIFTPLLNQATGDTSEIAASIQGKSESYQDIKDAQNSSNPYTLPLDWTSLDDQDLQLFVLYDLSKNAIANGLSKQAIAEINQAIAAAQQLKTYSIKNNPTVQNVWNKIKSGAWGNKVQQYATKDLRNNLKGLFTNSSGKGTGMNIEKNYNQAKDMLNKNINQNKTLATRNATLGIIQLALPFISTYFGNEAIRKAAEIYDQDITNTIHVNAIDY